MELRPVTSIASSGDAAHVTVSPELLVALRRVVPRRRRARLPYVVGVGLMVVVGVLGADPSVRQLIAALLTRS